jgi:hypothetical protein
MEYPLIMHVLETMTELDEPLKYLILSEWIIVSFSSIEISLKLAILSILHDDTDIIMMINIALMVAYNILMT